MTVEQLQEYMRDNPRSSLFARLADEYYRRRQFDEAVQLCINGLQVYPEYATAHIVIARCLVEKNDIPSALSYLQVALRTYPDNAVLATLRRKWEQLSSTILQAQPPRRENKPPERSTPAATKEETGEEHFVLDDVPIVSATLAEIYAAQGAYEAAIAMYRKLQRQKPQQSKQFEKKIEELRQKMQEGTKSGS